MSQGETPQGSGVSTESLATVELQSSLADKMSRQSSPHQEGCQLCGRLPSHLYEELPGGQHTVQQLAQVR